MTLLDISRVLIMKKQANDLSMESTLNITSKAQKDGTKLTGDIKNTKTTSKSNVPKAPNIYDVPNPIDTVTPGGINAY